MYGKQRNIFSVVPDLNFEHVPSKKLNGNFPYFEIPQFFTIASWFGLSHLFKTLKILVSFKKYF